jgi:hypothetical protein
MTLPEIGKTPLQRKLERLHGGRDIREVLTAAYDRHGGDLQAVADEFTSALPDPEDSVSYAALYQWIERWGWEIRTERRLVIPEAVA